MPTEKPRFTVVADDELLKAINRYQIRHHINAHTQAVRELLSLGIQLAEADDDAMQPPVLSSDEVSVLVNFRNSDPDTQIAVRCQLEESASRERPMLNFSDVKLPVHGVIELLQAFDKASPMVQHHIISLLHISPDSLDESLARSVDEKIPGRSGQSAEDETG